MFIYKIINDENDKVYVGKAKNIPERWKEHLKECTKTRSKGRQLYDEMNRIGKRKFHIRKLEECDAKDVEEREKYWIDYYDAKDDGYNSTSSGM